MNACNNSTDSQLITRLNWQDVALEDLATEITVGYVGPMASEYVAKGIPFLRSQNVEPLKINLKDLKFITPEFHKRLKKSSLKPGDVVLVRTGKPGACAVIPSWLPVANCSDLVIVRCGEKLNPFFLSYYVNSTATSHVSAHLVGAVQQHYNIGSARKMRLNLPPLAEQEAIVHFLRSLDKKIELNGQMNNTLEAFGEAVFRRWFVDFEFPDEEGKPYKSSGGVLVYNEELEKEIPAYWKIKKIGEVLTTVLGGTPDRGNPEHWNGDIAWINSGKINEFRIIQPSEYITKQGLENSATKLLPRRTTVIAITGATLGQVSLLEIDSCANQSVVGLLESEEIPSEYIYFWIKHTIQQIIAWQTGGAQQHINKNNVNDSLLLIPDKNVLSAYMNLVQPLLDRIALNCFENLNLAKIRDLSLPNLMSGKIRVPLVESNVEAV